MTTPLYRYPLDGTGVSPDNLVVGEEHQLSNRAVRCVAPTYGGFFAESVVVKDQATNLPLIYGIDYTFGELFEFPTGRYGKEIFGVIAITKPGVTAVTINYQALGGDYSYSMDAVIAMFDSLNLGERPSEWGKIVNRPALFDPASHLHDIGDVYGFEYLVHSIERLRNAILMGDVVSHDEIYLYIDRIANEQKNAVDAVTANLDAHIADKTNPHGVTKAQVGLSKVENYATATQAQMDLGTAADLYATPKVIAKYVDDKAGALLAAHVGDKTNPHAVTKTQVGLGSVQDYPVATTAEAVAGTVSTAYMTPLTVMAAIQSYAPDLNHTHSFASLTGKPTTIVGYGMTSVDSPSSVTAYTVVQAGVNNNGCASLKAGDATYSGWLEFTGANGYRAGYIGYASNPTATNQGTVNYVAKTHAFTGTVSATGDVIAYASDARLKTNLRPIENALEKVKLLRGWIYDWEINACANAGFTFDNLTEHGLLAQDVQKVVPDAVVPAPFNEEYLTVKYQRLIPLLVAGLNELWENFQVMKENLNGGSTSQL